MLEGVSCGCKMYGYRSDASNKVVFIISYARGPLCLLKLPAAVGNILWFDTLEAKQARVGLLVLLLLVLLALRRLNCAVVIAAASGRVLQLGESPPIKDCARLASSERKAHHGIVSAVRVRQQTWRPGWRGAWGRAR